MKKSIGFISVAAVILLLAGCASMSKEDCLVTDWYETGRLDGMQGKPRTGLQSRARACLEHGISADRVAYYQGHDEGLKHYCTEPRGFELGRQGQLYRSVCPAGLEKDFRAGYQNGIKSFCSADNGFDLGHRGQPYRYVCPPEFDPAFRAGYTRGRELYEYESKVASLQKRLKKIDRKIHQKEEALYSGKLTDVQRAEIRAEIRTLDLEYREILLELKYVEKSRPLALNQ